MASDNYKLFKEAIKESNPSLKQAIEGEYRSDGQLRRLWPLVLGFDEQGEEAVLCYQYEVDDVASAPPPLKNLRCYKIGFFAEPVTKIKFEGTGNPPKFLPKQVKKQTCVEDVRHYRAATTE